MFPREGDKKPTRATPETIVKVGSFGRQPVEQTATIDGSCLRHEAMIAKKLPARYVSRTLAVEAA